jgi:hypothetical protein
LLSVNLNFGNSVRDTNVKELKLTVDKIYVQNNSLERTVQRQGMECVLWCV